MRVLEAACASGPTRGLSNAEIATPLVTRDAIGEGCENGRPGEEPEDGPEPTTYRLQGTQPPRRSTRRIPVLMRDRAVAARINGTGYAAICGDSRRIGHPRRAGAQ